MVNINTTSGKAPEQNAEKIVSQLDALIREHQNDPEILAKMLSAAGDAAEQVESERLDTQQYAEERAKGIDFVKRLGLEKIVSDPSRYPHMGPINDTPIILSRQDYYGFIVAGDMPRHDEALTRMGVPTVVRVQAPDGNLLDLYLYEEGGELIPREYKGVKKSETQAESTRGTRGQLRDRLK